MFIIDLRRNISFESNASKECSSKFENLSASLVQFSKEYQESEYEKEEIRKQIELIDSMNKIRILTNFKKMKEIFKAIRKKKKK